MKIKVIILIIRNIIKWNIKLTRKKLTSLEIISKN